MSIQTVAREAGVSIATVSRVFNLPGRVASETREHVERVALALGYAPNASARTLRTHRSRALGVVLPTLLNPVFAECLEGIASAATEAGYSIQPLTTEYSIERENHAVGTLIAHGVDGMVMVASNPGTSAALRRVVAAGTPYVLAYNRHEAHPCVSVDGEAAVAALVERLAAVGHRRIALVTGQLAASDRAQQRCRGFRLAMRQAGLDASRILEVPFVQTAIEQIRALLQDTAVPRPSALVCSNDLLAIRSLRAAHLAGLAVPRDLSVIGFDGIALGEDLTPVLSSITQPNTEIGRCGVALLLQAMADGLPLTPASSLTLAHGFRAGESFAPA
ncbi:LacI family transcriptional regulator [Rhodoferax koreense]|uniref:LacI family transcriptional regulator n=1 Tax=Rhodoferax koreensis TaxID=1842727 RepID=A0A1P8JSW8_9BURK|nr:LacI family DNA-binding transcriptional regulator [Rhodoferax koreense]APW36853.1 LacI family transcriptional regulator [Rhodoferax koreense]